ncbi:ABC transporter G family member 6 [Morus notabilis]|uniref:ABC transporter G family member 6 n=1 Tax=Morus notabilis TaxID=981085 RepID=UPI000CED04E2|nr:ABC transporter G family member 6 [Morus notabilis]
MEDNNLQQLSHHENDDDAMEEEIFGGGGGEISTHRVLVDIGDGTENPEPQSFSYVLSFRNLSYNVNLRQKLTFQSLLTRTAKPITKIILKDISGEAHVGEILALVGASGSGKTTLLDALANRIEKESLKGSVDLNGEVLESRLQKAITAYVMQDDLLYPMLTVEETLMFAAKFRLPRTLEKSKKKERVQAAIDQLGLRSAARMIMGDEGHRGISGGERRRVSIGVDIIHDPVLLFLDEPTSGLDSTGAFAVVKVLKRIARSGNVVVMSIHQPSYQILDFLDRLIFLSHGEVVYRGSPRNLPVFFSGFGRPIPTNTNPVEFVLDLISELEDSTDGINGLVEFNKTWECPEFSTNSINGNVNGSNVLPLKDALNFGISRGKLIINDSTNFPSFANPLWIETLILLKRSITNSRRSPGIFLIQFLTILFGGVFIASLFWQLDESSQGVQELLSFFAYTITLPFFCTCQSLPLYLQDRDIFIRETAYNTYRRFSYVLSRSLVDLPLLIIFTLTLSTITFWGVGIAGDLVGFMFYFLIICGSFLVGNSVTAFVSGLVPNILIGFTVVMLFSGYSVLLCGFFLHKDQIPPYWIWFHYIAVSKYTYEALVRNEFERPTKCFERAVEMFDNTPFANVSPAMKASLLGDWSTSLGMNVTSSTCTRTGFDVLQEQSFSDLNKWNYMLVLLSWCFFYWILFFFSLLLGNKNKRK